MADTILTAMVAPNIEVTYETRSGVPYRADATGICMVKSADIADLTAQGFVVATAANVPPGEDLQDDVGW